MSNNTNNTDLPPIPEDYCLYGRGPLPFPSSHLTDDIISHLPGSSLWTPGWCGGSDIRHFALRIGSEIWARNCGEVLDDFQRRTAVEAEEAAQRIIALEAECGRLAEQRDAAIKQRNTASARVLELESELLEVREAWDKDHREMKRRVDAAMASVVAKGADLFDYGNLVTKLAETLGMSTMEISLDEVLERVKELAAKLDTFQSNSKLARLYAETQEHVEVLRKRVIDIDNERSVVCRERDALQEKFGIVCSTVRSERDGWRQTAAQHLRNEQFYRDLLGRCAELLGDECRRCDDGSMVPKGDFLALRVPEVLAGRLAAEALRTQAIRLERPKTAVFVFHYPANMDGCRVLEVWQSLQDALFPATVTMVPSGVQLQQAVENVKA